MFVNLTKTNTLSRTNFGYFMETFFYDMINIVPGKHIEGKHNILIYKILSYVTHTLKLLKQATR